ncbi:MAG: hypothetical protein ACRDD1_02185, partial [Planctomycetia bacterium]
ETPESAPKIRRTLSENGLPEVGETASRTLASDAGPVGLWASESSVLLSKGLAESRLRVCGGASSIAEKGSLEAAGKDLTAACAAGASAGDENGLTKKPEDGERS